MDFVDDASPALPGRDAGSTFEKQVFSVKSIDTERRRITAIASREIIDRDGEVVTLAALREAVDAYMKNPVILAGHKHSSPDGKSTVVGSVVEYEFKGKDFIITVEFAGTPLGLEYWQLYRDKHQRAFSIGFRVLDSKVEHRDGKNVRILTKIELYEISCVAVPANPAALSKAKFIQKKQLDREKQRILADDAAYCDLLERFSAVCDEHGDAFGNLPEDSGVWLKFSAAERELLAEHVETCKGWGFDEADFAENWPRCENDGLSGAEDEDYSKSILGDPGAFLGGVEGDDDFEPDYAGFFV